MIALEPIYAALWAKVSGLSGINYTSRRPQLPQNLSDGQFPALFMNQLEVDAKNDGSGTGTILTIPTEFLIYVNTGADPNAIPTIALNGLIDQVRAAILSGIPGVKQTLGGLVVSVYTTGKIEVFEGNLGQHGIAIVPITCVIAED